MASGLMADTAAETGVYRNTKRHNYSQQLITGQRAGLHSKLQKLPNLCPRIAMARILLKALVTGELIIFVLKLFANHT